MISLARIRQARTLLTLAAMLFAAPALAPTLALAQQPAPATAPPVAAAPAPAPDPTADPTAGLAAWEKIYAVLSHPRCANCHVEDDHPRWSGKTTADNPRFHAFNVQRGADGFGNPGLRCGTCHFDNNSNILNGPPGAPKWHLAPKEMVWFGKSSADICAQIKDPARNGNRTPQEVADHIAHDKLVQWGWAPGPGREPPPGSARETYDELEKWMAAGTPCPAN